MASLETSMIELAARHPIHGVHLHVASKTPGETQRLKKEFRLNWAKEYFEANTKVRHRQEESWSRVQGGAWRLHAVRQDRAGAAAVKAATLYAMKALAMGGEWITYNVMTERTDILYLQYSRDSTFTRSRFLEAKCNGASLATEESEPSETNVKAACETPVLPVQIKECKQTAWDAERETPLRSF